MEKSNYVVEFDDGKVVRIDGTEDTMILVQLRIKQLIRLGWDDTAIANDINYQYGVG